MVVMKLIEPRIDEAPAIWSDKIAMSTEAPPWNWTDDKGG
jgi:hypothetical protein